MGKSTRKSNKGNRPKGPRPGEPSRWGIGTIVAYSVAIISVGALAVVITQRKEDGPAVSTRPPRPVVQKTSMTPVKPVKPTESTGFFAIESLGKQGRYEEAVEKLKVWVEKYPSDPELLLRLGAAQKLAGDPEGAEATFKSILTLDTANADAHYALGLLYKDQGFVHKAIDTLTAAADYDRGRKLDAIYQKGLLYLRINEPQQALRQFQGILEEEPGNGLGHWGAGSAQMVLKRYEDAAKSLEAALTVRPKFIEARINLGIAYTYLGRYTNAIAMLKECHNQQPGESKITFNLAVAQLEAGALDQSTTLFEVLARSDGIFKRESMYRLALISSLRKDKEQALRWWRKTLNSGFDELERVEAEERMAYLRGLEEYKKIMSQKHKERRR